jgi:hypothetical protein
MTRAASKDPERVLQGGESVSVRGFAILGVKVNPTRTLRYFQSGSSGGVSRRLRLAGGVSSGV